MPARCHDFPDPALGKAIPHGVYDPTTNERWVSVGTNHDPSAFAVQSIRSWWRQEGVGLRALLLVMLDWVVRRVRGRWPGSGTESA